MDNYKEYLEERLLGMYNLLESSNSVVLEAHKEKTVDKEKGEKALKSFISFAKKHDPEEGEKLEKEPSRAKQAIKKDWKIYKEWRDKHAALNEVLILFLFGLAGVGIQEINRRQARKKEAKK